jgi:hypothetical protein
MRISHLDNTNYKYTELSYLIEMRYHVVINGSSEFADFAKVRHFQLMMCPRHMRYESSLVPHFDGANQTHVGCHYAFLVRLENNHKKKKN